MELVFLVRHGETQWNRQGRRQGQLDSPLTPEGISRARCHAAVLLGHAVDAVFSSPLGRALTTSQIIGEALGLPVNVLGQLSEVHHGSFAGLTNADIERSHPGEMARRAGDKYRWAFPGGESYADADERAGAALAAVAATASRRPLLVSHEMIGKMLLRHLLGLEPQEALARAHPHDTIYEVDPVRRDLRRLY
jgi:broad specificity phosphatase PhoE